MNKTRNGEIDFLRFVFILLIVMLHLTEGIFPQGNISVEFFFTLSGFLMARHAERIAEQRSLSLDSVADETWAYIKGKFQSFYRYYFAAFVLVVLHNCILLKKGFLTIIKNLFGSIPTLTLTFFFLNYDTVSFEVGASWYLSAMLIAMFILYPILLKNYRFAVKIVFPLIAVFLLGYEQAVNGTIYYWKEWAGLTRFGVLRAVSEIALGGVFYYFSTLITKDRSLLINSDRPIVKGLLTAVKLICYLVPVAFARKTVFGIELDRKYQLHCLIFCGIGIVLSFCNIGYCIPDSKLTRFLGKISLPIFIFHRQLSYTWKKLLALDSVSTSYSLVMVAGCIVISVILMYITDSISDLLKKTVLSIRSDSTAE